MAELNRTTGRKRTQAQMPVCLYAMSLFCAVVGVAWVACRVLPARELLRACSTLCSAQRCGAEQLALASEGPSVDHTQGLT